MSAPEASLKILVIGANNFLGKELCNLLILQNCQLFAFDKFNEIDQKDFEALSTKKNFKLINFDVSQGLPELPVLNHIFFVSLSNNATLDNLTKASIGIKNVLDKVVKDNAKFLLISTTDIYKGIVSSTSLEHYFGTDEQDFEKYEYQEASRFTESLVTEYFRQSKIDARIVRTSQVYGPGMSFDESGEVGEIIEQAINGDIITIHGDGLEIVEPIYIADIIFGINKAMFGQNTAGKIFTLIGPESLTLLSLAYKLKEILRSSKEIEIKFKHKKGLRLPSIHKTRNGSDLAWEAKTHLETGLKQTVNHFRDVKQEFSVESPIVAANGSAPLIIQRSDSINKNIKLKIPTFQLKLPKFKFGLNYRLLLIILIIFLFLQPFVEAALGMVLLKSSITQITRQQFKSAQFQSEIAGKLLEISLFQINGINSFIKNKLKFEFLSYETSLISGIYQTGLAVTQITKSGEEVGTLFGSVFNQQSNDDEVAQQLKLIKEDLILVSEKLSIAQLNFNDVQKPPLGIYSDKFQKVKDSLPIFKDSINKAIDFIEIYPKLAGIENDKKYLIIFQNNLEIRPTGGFIGSYGVASIEEGKLKEIKIDDVYNIDGQLTQKFEPPKPLKDNLGVENWYLRDSNWNPDFSLSAPIINHFYELESKESVDGIIAIDVGFVEKLLKVMGPVYLENYNETISAENLFEKAEYYSEINFTPGSTSKKDFLSSLSKKLIDTIISNSADLNLLGMALATNSALNEKHLMFWFKEPDLQIFAIENNFAGQTRTLDKNDDYLLVADANVGANKANAFTQREITYQPIIKRDGDILSRLEITYRNNSPADTWPAGKYKNYVQIVTPAGSSLESILNGENALKEQVVQTQTADKNTFGFLVEVPIQQEVKVKLEYKIPVTIATSGGDYQLYIQKQPGSQNDRLTINVSYPSYLKPVASSQKAAFSSQSVSFSQALDTDKSLRLKFETQ